jgi:general secretion pathway protein D
MDGHGDLCRTVWPADESVRPAITASVEKAREAGAPTGPDAVTLNFVNADIGSVVKVVSEITVKNFVFDPWVKGEINIVAAMLGAATMRQCTYSRISLL